MHAVDASGLKIGREHPPRIMGILNVSEESPYDPSVFTDPQAAAEYVDTALIEAGADIVDVGLESANKRYDVLSEQEELDRLSIALETLDAVTGDAIFSIETRYAQVAEESLNSGFDMVNDICGFADPAMADIATDYDVPIVKMAGPGEIERPGALSSVDEIYDALAAEPLPKNTIIDPAFGGWSEEKDESVDRDTFHRLGEFRAIGRPILVSINRKNFLRNLAGRSTEEALPVSLAATSMAIERGADVIRTHDVAATRDAAIVANAFRDESHRDGEIGFSLFVNPSERELERHLVRINAPRAAATDGVTHCFELFDVDTIEATLLSQAVTDGGATYVSGANDRSFLFATTRELRHIRSLLKDESPVLVDVLTRMIEAIS